jgi:hypothetical protein
MATSGISAGASLALMVALCMQQGITTLGNGTSLVDSSAPYQPTANDGILVKRCATYYVVSDLRTYNNIGTNPNPTNVLTYLQCSSSADPNYAPRAADASPIVLSHPGTTFPFWLAHGSADIVSKPQQSTLFSSTCTTIATGVGHNFLPTASGPELAANLTIWAGGRSSLLGGL